MKINKYILPLILILAIIGLAFTHKIWLPLAGEFLVPPDKLEKADCIVVLQGDPYFRFKKAVELYNAGMAKRIVVSPLREREAEFEEYYNFNYRILGIKDISVKELTTKAFEYFGKDMKDVYLTGDEATSTYDEAAAARKFMMNKDLKSLILVTSAYHMRRSLIIFRLVFRGTGIKIYYCTAKNPLFNPRRWWLKETDAREVLNEYLSITYNIFYHFILGKERTAFDI